MSEKCGTQRQTEGMEEPSRESRHNPGAGMLPEIMDSWQLSFQGDDAAFLKQGPETKLQARAAVSPSTPGSVPYEGRIVGFGKLSLDSDAHITIHFLGNIAVEGNQPALVEFRRS